MESKAEGKDEILNAIGVETCRERRRLKLVKRLKSLNLSNLSRNASLNISIVKETLKANNRALARALEQARTRFAATQQTLLDREREIQDLQENVGKLRRVAGLRDDQIEQEVRQRMNEKHRHIRTLMERMSQSLLDTADYIPQVLVELDDSSNQNSRGPSLDAGSNSGGSRDNGGVGACVTMTTTEVAKRETRSISVSESRLEQEEGADLVGAMPVVHTTAPRGRAMRVQRGGAVLNGPAAPGIVDLSIVQEQSVLDISDDLPFTEEPQPVVPTVVIEEQSPEQLLRVLRKRSRSKSAEANSMSRSSARSTGGQHRRARSSSRRSDLHTVAISPSDDDKVAMTGVGDQDADREIMVADDAEKVIGQTEDKVIGQPDETSDLQISDSVPHEDRPIVSKFAPHMTSLLPVTPKHSQVEGMSPHSRAIITNKTEFFSRFVTLEPVASPKSSKTKPKEGKKRNQTNKPDKQDGKTKKAEETNKHTDQPSTDSTTKPVGTNSTDSTTKPEGTNSTDSTTNPDVTNPKEDQRETKMAESKLSTKESVNDDRKSRSKRREKSKRDRSASVNPTDVDRKRKGGGTARAMSWGDVPDTTHPIPDCKIVCVGADTTSILRDNDGKDNLDLNPEPSVTIVINAVTDSSYTVNSPASENAVSNDENTHETAEEPISSVASNKQTKGSRRGTFVLPENPIVLSKKVPTQPEDSETKNRRGTFVVAKQKGRKGAPDDEKENERMKDTLRGTFCVQKKPTSDSACGETVSNNGNKQPEVDSKMADKMADWKPDEHSMECNILDESMPVDMLECPSMNNSLNSSKTPDKCVANEAVTLDNKKCINPRDPRFDTTTCEEQDMEFTTVLPAMISTSTKPDALKPAFIQNVKSPDFLRNVSPCNEALKEVSCPPKDNSHEKENMQKAEKRSKDTDGKPKKSNENREEHTKSTHKIQESRKDKKDKPEGGQDKPQDAVKDKKVSEVKSSDKTSASSSEDEPLTKKELTTFFKKPGKIFFTAGRRNIQDLMKGEKGIPSAQPRARKTSKARSKPILPSTSPLNASRTSSKNVYDLSLNESIPVPSSISYGQFREVTVARKEQEKQATDDETSGEGGNSGVANSGDGATSVQDKEHGIMLVLGNGKRTKPRNRKSVHYAQVLTDEHLITPCVGAIEKGVPGLDLLTTTIESTSAKSSGSAPTIQDGCGDVVKADTAETERKNAGHTPPRKALSKAAQRRNSKAIQSGNQEITTEATEDHASPPSTPSPPARPSRGATDPVPTVIPATPDSAEETEDGQPARSSKQKSRGEEEDDDSPFVLAPTRKRKSARAAAMVIYDESDSEDFVISPLRKRRLRSSSVSTSGQRESTSGQRESTSGQEESTSGQEEIIYGQQEVTSGKEVPTSGQNEVTSGEQDHASDFAQITNEADVMLSPPKEAKESVSSKGQQWKSRSKQRDEQRGAEKQETAVKKAKSKDERAERKLQKEQERRRRKEVEEEVEEAASPTDRLADTGSKSKCSADTVSHQSKADLQRLWDEVNDIGDLPFDLDSEAVSQPEDNKSKKTANKSKDSKTVGSKQTKEITEDDHQGKTKKSKKGGGTTKEDVEEVEDNDMKEEDDAMSVRESCTNQDVEGSEGCTGGRRARKPVSYKELSINQKMRRGDNRAKTIYSGKDAPLIEVYKAKKRRFPVGVGSKRNSSLQTRPPRQALNTITNLV